MNAGPPTNSGDEADRTETATVAKLATGALLGPYRIEALLGAGGMGEVYKARDTRLDRLVAIKISHQRFSDRFEREARAIAALNHPNICTVYDVGPNYLVMELVDGESLVSQLGKGRLSLEVVLRHGVQIADGLAAAHAKGITHRDLKPGNIMVTKSGIKILDFGLAKQASALDDTLTVSHAIVGTPAYMAPEQLEGKPSDARTDIFALGLVLYEMASGARLSPRDHLVLDGFPDQFAHILERCLVKDPGCRWQTASDLKLELEWAGSHRPNVSAIHAKSRWRYWPILAGFAVLALSLVIYSRAGSPAPAVYSFSPFATEAPEENYPAWSPDGKTIAYFAEVDGVKQIFTKSLASTTPVQITKSAVDCTNPFWSPDGTRVYYLSRGLWSVGAAGGEPQAGITNIQAAAISSRNTLAFIKGPGGNMSLWVASAPTAEPVQYRQAPFPEIFVRAWTVDFSRDGSKLAVLMEREGAAGFTTELWTVPFPSGSPERVPGTLPFPTSGPLPARISWLPDNRHLVLDTAVPGSSGNHLHQIDTTSGTMKGMTSGTGEEFAPAVSPDGGKIALSAGGIDFDLMQISIDASEIRTLLGTASREGNPAWSPSGRQFAYISNAGGGSELWVRSVQESWASPVLRQRAEGLPVWYNLERPSFSPDGNRIAYGVNGSRHAIWISSVAGSRPVPLDAQSHDQHGPSWSKDGNWIAYQRFFEGKWEVVKMPLGGGQPIHLADGTPGGSPTAWSPTGECIAFTRGGALQLVSQDGKIQKTLTVASPAFGFSQDGSQIYGVRRGPNRTWELVVTDIANGTSRKAGDLRWPSSAIITGFSLHPDGKSFLTSVGIPKFDIWLLDGLKVTR
jgi:eukaryotic-like serine/threonine-protein kinase